MTLIGLLVTITLFLGIVMGCIWAFVALWNFVHHGPPGVPLPKGFAKPLTPSTDIHFEYRSPRQWLGMPLVHIVRRPDPATGKMPVARGVIAIGVKAHGVVAIGVIASGGLALGVLAFGVFALGSLAIGIFAGGAGAIGLLAGGSLAIGAVSAIGVNVIGDIAKGVNSIGRYYVSGVTQYQIDWLRTPLWSGAAVIALIAIIPWKCPPTWPRAHFRAVLAVLAFAALGIIKTLLPLDPMFQEIPARNRIGFKGAIAYESSVIHPEAHALEVALDIPFGWIADFNFFVRDEKGVHELPWMSFSAGQKTPPANLRGPKILPLGGRWEFGQPIKDGVPHIPVVARLINSTKAEGSWKNGSSSFQFGVNEYRGYRWEAHPKQWRSGTFNPKPGADIPFLRGFPAVPGAPGAEIILSITVRPMSETFTDSEYRVIEATPQKERLKQFENTYEPLAPGAGYEKLETEVPNSDERISPQGKALLNDKNYSELAFRIAAARQEVNGIQSRIPELLQSFQEGHRTVVETRALYGRKLKELDALEYQQEEVVKQYGLGGDPFFARLLREAAIRRKQATLDELRRKFKILSGKLDEEYRRMAKGFGDALAASDDANKESVERSNREKLNDFKATIKAEEAAFKKAEASLLRELSPEQ
jgi:hypothetical protein